MKKEEIRFQVVCGAVKAFLEDGNLEINILNQLGFEGVPKVKMVSLTQDGNLKILVHGKCPCCEVKHVRNICNVRFTNNCVKPVVLGKFKQVKNVSCLLTYDGDFEEQVRKLGGNVKLAPETEKRMKFFEFECFFFEDPSRR